MEWPDVEDIASQRRPRRVSTLPARFTGPGQPEVIVERIVPAYERWPSRDDAPRRGPISAEDDLPDPYYLRRRDSSFREPAVPIIDARRPKSVRHHSRDRSLERRRRRGQRRSRSPPRSRSESSSPNRSRSLSSDSSDSFVLNRYSRRRHRSARYDSSDESEREWDVNQEAYAFSLSRNSRSSLGQDSTSRGSTEPSLKPQTNSDLQVGVDGPKLGTTLHVYRSKYTGEGSVGGSQTAQLNVIHDQKKDQSPLFRWIHFEDPTMHFDDLQNRVTQISGLTDIERTGLTKLLGRVRKKHDKPLQTSKGTKVRFMEPGFMQETLSQGDRPQDKLSRARAAIWICLPYFCLAEYSGVLSASRSGAHPMQTLLQARFSLVQKDRDLQQAVCNLLGTPPGFCFHIAQLWCLVLDDSLLVTCARIPMSALQGEAISIISDPMPVQSRGKSPKILVSCGGSVLWSLPVEDCQTWFSFISNFSEFWPRKLRTLHNGKFVMAEDWPRLLNLAKHASHSIRLALQMGSMPQVSTRGILNSSPRPPTPSSSTSADVDSASRDQHGTFQASASISDDAAERSLHPPADGDNVENQGGAEDEDVLDPPASRTATHGGKSFHAFTWLNAEQTSQRERAFNFNVEQLKEDLENMDYFLSHKTTFVEQIAYKECPQISRLEVYSLLEQERRTLVRSAAKEKKQDEKKSKIYEVRVDIVNAAESIFQFFLPSLFEGPTVLKYWGVIHRLLVASSPDRPIGKRKYPRRRPKKGEDFHPTVWELDVIHGELDVIVRRTQPFKDLLSQAQAADRSEIKIPDELPKAWLHVIMSLINYTRDSSLWEDQMNTCASLIEQGMKKVVQSLNRKSLLERSVFMPFEVTSLINFQLLQDLTGTQSGDISETYSVYLKRLEAEIEANPLDRAHQDKITLLKQEMSVITETLQKQREIFATIMVSSRTRNHGKLASYERNYDHTRSTREPQHLYSKSRVDPGYNAQYEYDAGHNASPHMAEDPIYVEDPTRNPRSQLSPTDPGGYRDLLVQDCFDLIHKRMRDFDEMNGKATDLETWNIQKIDSNRDRQESAVYAFTIVTIVFLPLSTVAGILGMNTNDVRNMNVNQWVFWAVALPVTFIIIGLCLLWAGELDNFWRGFVNLWRRSGGKGKAGYRRVPYHPTPPPQVAPAPIDYEDYGRPRLRERSDLYGQRSYAYV